MRIIERKKAFFASLLLILVASINISISEAAKPIKPSTPTNLTVTYTYKYFLSWAAVPTASTGYEMRWQQYVNGHWRWIAHSHPIGDATSTSTSFFRIFNATSRFGIRAANGKHKSKWSDWVFFDHAVVNNPPIANAGADQSVKTGDVVSLSGSFSSDPDGDTLTYQWTMTQKPSGSSALISNPQQVNASFVADLPGLYTVSLVVSDGDLSSSPNTVDVNTSDNLPPIANAGIDQAVNTSNTVTLNGSGSSDPNGDALSIQWAFTQIPVGSTASLSNATVSNPSFVADQPGTYTASLVVSDGLLSSAPDTVTITATNLNSTPIANAGADISGIVGHLAILNGTGSSDVDGDTLSYNWQISSRPFNSQAVLNSSTSSSPSITPDVSGQFLIDLIVSDGTVGSAPDQVILNVVANNIPIANAGTGQTVSPGQLVTLDGSQSSDLDGDAITYLWSFVETPTGSTASLLNQGSPTPTFTADISGQYIAQLIVNDGIADSAPVTVNISASTLTLVVSTPQDGLITSDTSITISGTIIDVNPSIKNIGVTVNGEIAIMNYDASPLEFIVRVPLIVGEQTLTAIATTQLGETANKSLSVTRLSGDSYDVEIEPESGVAPLDVNLALSLNTANNYIVSVTADFDDDGFDDFTYDGIEFDQNGNILVRPLNLSIPIPFSYTVPGTFQARIRVLDLVSLQNNGTSFTEHIVPVEVIHEALNESLFTNIWNGMNNAVLAGNLTEAETAFTAGAKTKFGPVLAALQPYYQEIVNTYTQWQVINSFPGYKEFALNRTINGENKIYFIRFSRDISGVWRISSM